MRRIKSRAATAPGTAMGGPRPPRRSKEDVSVAARRAREVGTSCAPADKRDVHVQPIFEDVARRQSHTGARGQNPGQESLRHQGVALGSCRGIDLTQAQ
jgi:hypothetical protein